MVGGAVVLFSAVILLGVADIKVYQKRQKLISQIENLKNKIQDLQNKNDDLKKGIARADDDTYIEKVAREELNLQKPGEKVVSFVKSPNQQEENRKDQKIFLEIWLGWLGNGWQWLKNQF